MELPAWPTTAFNILIAAQRGRLDFEAALFALSLRGTNPGFGSKLFVATPVASDLWPQDPSLLTGPLRDLLSQQNVEFVEFESRNFGQTYPFGNKIEALEVLPAGQPFGFFNSDTLITAALSNVPFNLDRPGASRRREAHGQKLRKKVQTTPPSGARFTTALVSTYPGHWIIHGPLQIGAAISILTLASFTIAVPKFSASCTASMLSISVRARRQNWPDKRWTPGWIKWRCRW